MQFGMQFWCELAASAMAAGLVYMGLGLFLSEGEEDFDPDSVLSANQAVPDEQAPSDEDGVLDFLREAVRLAEERLKAQEEHSRALERKATLLGALCVCVCTVAFLLAGGFDTAGALPVKRVAIVLLIVSAACRRCLQGFDAGRFCAILTGLDTIVPDVSGFYPFPGFSHGCSKIP